MILLYSSFFSILKKKLGLNPDSMTHFQPISNPPYRNTLLPLNFSLATPQTFSIQSQHSTETAFLKVNNDPHLSANSGHLSILILLVLNAAFGTINHSILLSCLETSLNITSTALSWLKSTVHPYQQLHLLHSSSVGRRPPASGAWATPLHPLCVCHLFLETFMDTDGTTLEGQFLRSRLSSPLTSEGEKQFLWGQQCEHLAQRGQMVVYVKLGRQSLSRRGGLRHYLSPTYNAVLSSLPRQLNRNSHQDSSSSNNPLEDQFDQQHTNGPNDSETQSSHVSLPIL